MSGLVADHVLRKHVFPLFVLTALFIALYVAYKIVGDPLLQIVKASVADGGGGGERSNTRRDPEVVVTRKRVGLKRRGQCNVVSDVRTFASPEDIYTLLPVSSPQDTDNQGGRSSGHRLPSRDQDE